MSTCADRLIKFREEIGEIVKDLSDLELPGHWISRVRGTGLSLNTVIDTMLMLCKEMGFALNNGNDKAKKLAALVIDTPTALTLDPTYTAKPVVVAAKPVAAKPVVAVPAAPTAAIPGAAPVAGKKGPAKAAAVVAAPAPAAPTAPVVTAPAPAIAGVPGDLAELVDKTTHVGRGKGALREALADVQRFRDGDLKKMPEKAAKVIKHHLDNFGDKVAPIAPILRKLIA